MGFVVENLGFLRWLWAGALRLREEQALEPGPAEATCRHRTQMGRVALCPGLPAARWPPEQARTSQTGAG